MAFPNNVLISMNAAKVNNPSESGSEERGRSQQSSLTFKGEWHNTAGFWQGKKGVFYTTNENF